MTGAAEIAAEAAELATSCLERRRKAAGVGGSTRSGPAAALRRFGNLGRGVGRRLPLAFELDDAGRAAHEVPEPGFGRLVVLGQTIGTLEHGDTSVDVSVPEWNANCLSLPKSGPMNRNGRRLDGPGARAGARRLD